jgi:hypothetical protein
MKLKENVLRTGTKVTQDSLQKEGKTRMKIPLHSVVGVL